jgi:hypothetical protein
MLAAMVLFIIKQCPVWVMPLLPANIIDIVAQRDRGDLQLFVHPGSLPDNPAGWQG